MSLLKRLAPLALLGSLFFASPQPIEAQNFYITGGIGALEPSDSNYQQIYGVIPELKLGLVQNQKRVGEEN